MKIASSPKISVFITSYNQKEFLKEAINSVLAQTLQPFEILIVDDCSTDGSDKLIKRFALENPKLIRHIIHKKNLGVAKNKKFALNQVRGNLISYLDGDDRFLPDKLEKEYSFLTKNPEAKIVYSNVDYIDKNGRKIDQWATEKMPPTGYIFQDTFSRNFPKNQLFRNELISIECIKKVGGYNEELDLYEDWDLRIRLTKHFNVTYCPFRLTEYRKHENNISKSPYPKHLEQLLRVYKINEELLDDLPVEEKEALRKRLFEFFSFIATNAIVYHLEKNNKHGAFETLKNCQFLRTPVKGLFLLFLISLPFPLFYHTLRNYRKLKEKYGTPKTNK